MSALTPDDSRETDSSKPPAANDAPPSLFHSILIVVWLAALALAVWLSSNRSYLFASIIGTISISAIPFVAARSWQDRITAILVMPFIGASLVAGVAIYFVMVLNFSWFQGVFGTKGGGPLGVVLFAFSFSLAGGFAGYRCVRLARRLR